MKIQPQLVIFDMDGLIFDSEKLYFTIFTQEFNAIGLDFPFELFSSLVGLNHIKSAAICREHFGQSAEIDQLIEKVNQISYDMRTSSKLEIKPGAQDLMEYLKQAGIRMALSSSTFIEEVGMMLGSAGLSEYFDVIVGGDMIKVGKPDPDAFLLPCQLCGIQPQDALVLEDSQPGIEAASSAGIPVICVPDIREPDPFHRNMTCAVVENLFDVVKIIDTLPQRNQGI